MPIVVGIDEAGYGPMLGPLVVGATIWEVDTPTVVPDFWEALKASVCRKPVRADFRLRVDDSKKVHDRKAGLAGLERTILAFSHAVGLPCDTLERLLNGLTRETSIASATQPWYADLNRKLPTDPLRGAPGSMAARLTTTMDASAVRCRGLGIQLVTEGTFNQRVSQTHNKASIIVEHVLRLITRAVRLAGDQEMWILVDRLGGRSNYREILQTAFPDRALRILEISNESSRYRLSRFDDGGPHRGDWTIEFTVQADSHYLPVALAGMLCKYCRELLMHEFNVFWHKLDPALRPTAGYYTDAKRFLRDIGPLLPESGLSQEQFVRSR